MEAVVRGKALAAWGWFIFLRDSCRIEEETLEGVVVKGHSRGVPLASGFGIGPPPRGSTAYRRAIQVP